MNTLIHSQMNEENHTAVKNILIEAECLQVPLTVHH